MVLTMSSLYDVRAANVDEESVRKASEEVANYDNRIADLRGEVKLVKWMAGFDLAIGVAILIRLFA